MWVEWSELMVSFVTNLLACLITFFSFMFFRLVILAISFGHILFESTILGSWRWGVHPFYLFIYLYLSCSFACITRLASWIDVYAGRYIRIGFKQDHDGL